MKLTPEEKILVDMYPPEETECVVDTTQTCPYCNLRTRLDTQNGIEKVVISWGMPNILCDCKRQYPIKIDKN